MKKLRCGVCRRSTNMDFPGFLGDTCKALGVQVCAHCSNGPRWKIKESLGLGRGRGARGLPGNGVSGRVCPEMPQEEYQLWCLDWLAYWLTGMACAVTRTGLTMNELTEKWYE